MFPHHQHPMYYSQNDEEKYIVEACASIPEGKLLEIGAFDGKCFSNTLKLIEMGWSGVLVEPSPMVFPALLRLHMDNPKVELVNCAVGASGGFTTFYDSMGDAVSSVDPAHAEKWHAHGGINFKKYTLPLIRLDDFFNHYGVDFDFFNLDVESINMRLFHLLPKELFERLHCICIEHDYCSDQVISTLEPYGFKTRMVNGENVVMSK